ncbi:hypothetical protein NA56DRAFT_699888 [Hyaloscypha hepaticicola]|uniref:Uncharacterized protein n=1 Tax=Hyaloscypha hepaticicola TaxID=2082293 RepID=A0A2J6QFP8_9HELO|nr:hypothetical protein NA56DRAFT_699888 [Hyaloscypha hepaticicola]
MQHYLENKDWVGFRKTFERSEALEAPRIGDGLYGQNAGSLFWMLTTSETRQFDSGFFSSHNNVRYTPNKKVRWVNIKLVADQRPESEVDKSITNVQDPPVDVSRRKSSQLVVYPRAAKLSLADNHEGRSPLDDEVVSATQMTFLKLSPTASGHEGCSERLSSLQKMKARATARPTSPTSGQQQSVQPRLRCNRRTSRTLIIHPSLWNSPELPGDRQTVGFAAQSLLQISVRLAPGFVDSKVSSRRKLAALQSHRRCSICTAQARITSNPSRQYGARRWHESQLSAPSPPYAIRYGSVDSQDSGIGAVLLSSRISFVSDQDPGRLPSPPTNRNASNTAGAGAGAGKPFALSLPRTQRPLASPALLYRYTFRPQPPPPPPQPQPQPPFTKATSSTTTTTSQPAQHNNHRRLLCTLQAQCIHLFPPPPSAFIYGPPHSTGCYILFS